MYYVITVLDILDPPYPPLFLLWPASRPISDYVIYEWSPKKLIPLFSSLTVWPTCTNHVIHYRVTNIHFWKFSPLLKKIWSMVCVDYYTYYSHMKCDEFCTSESTFEEHIPIQKSCSTECLLFLLVWISLC